MYKIEWTMYVDDILRDELYKEAVELGMVVRDLIFFTDHHNNRRCVDFEIISNDYTDLLELRYKYCEIVDTFHSLVEDITDGSC